MFFHQILQFMLFDTTSAALFKHDFFFFLC